MWVCKRWWRMVVPRPPVVPVMRIGEGGGDIVVSDYAYLGPVCSGRMS